MNNFHFAIELFYSITGSIFEWLLFSLLILYIVVVKNCKIIFEYYIRGNVY